MNSGTPFGAVMRRLAGEDPDRPALTGDGVTLTRREVEERSNRLARALAERGVGNAGRVAIVLPNGVEFVLTAMAAWKVGAAPVPLSVKLPPAERAAILDLAQPDCVADVTGLAADEAAGRPVLDPATDGTDHDADPLPDVIAPCWKIMPSGGSTGRPKLIATTEPAVIERAGLFGLAAQLHEDRTALVTAPLTHNAPFMATAVGLLFGNHVVLMRRFDAAEVLRLAERHRADWVYAVPTMMHRIWRLPEETRAAADLSSVRVVFHLGAPCPPWLKQAWIDWLGPERVWELYAGTEAQAATLINGTEWLEHRGSVGRPLLGEIEVRDPDGAVLPPGQVGEVWMRPDSGEGATYSYIGADARGADGGWESLGDLGYVDADGYLYLTDRDTDMLLVGGANVYPAEVEAALDEHPAVRSSAVIGLPDDDLGSAPHAIVQLAIPAGDGELHAHLAERLAVHKRPRTIERVDHPLRDDAGKIRRPALRAERLTGPDTA